MSLKLTVGGIDPGRHLGLLRHAAELAARFAGKKPMKRRKGAVPEAFGTPCDEDPECTYQGTWTDPETGQTWAMYWCHGELRAYTI